MSRENCKMNQRGKSLLFITAEFPFGKGETFIENELPILAEGFERILIISLAEATEHAREVPENVTVQRSPVKLTFLQKIGAFRHIFKSEVRNEIKRVNNVYKLPWSKAIIATIFFSWERANRIARLVESKLTENTISYAYWSDDSAIALAQLKRRFPEMKCISRCHGWDVYFEASGIDYLPFRELLTDRIDRVVAISEAGLRYIQKRWKISKKDMLSYSRLGTTRRLDKWRSQQLARIPLIVSCSNVIPVKRVHLIAKALGELKESSFHWVHFGDGIQMSSLKELVKELGISDLVTFKGRCPNHEVLMFLQNNPVKFFINVSASEGIPVSIMEAMSLGIPVLATDVGGTSELVNHENGWLVDKGISIADLALVISRILNEDQAILQEKSKKAFETWETKYNAERNFQVFVEELFSMSDR